MRVPSWLRRRPSWRVLAAVAVVGVLLAGVVVWLSTRSDDEAAGCEDDEVTYLADDQAGLCYATPDGWVERSTPPEVDLAVSSMITNDDAGGPATAMAGGWQEVFDAEPPGDSLEDAARWLVGESGPLGAEGTDISSEDTDLDGHQAAAATGTTGTEPAVELRATVVEVTDGELSFLLTIAPESGDGLASEIDDIHTSLAVQS